MSWEWDVLRLMAATLAGVLLSVSGSLLQLTTRNELATPSTLGMDGLAVLAVILGHAAALFLPFMPEDLSLLFGISFGVVVWAIAGKYRLPRAEDFRLVLWIRDQSVGGVIVCSYAVSHTGL
jgi:ABC-type Fe3+-siderophore transport system permease subunit